MWCVCACVRACLSVCLCLCEFTWSRIPLRRMRPKGSEWAGPTVKYKLELKTEIGRLKRPSTDSLE